MENPIEKGPERFLTKEEIMEKIKSLSESAEVRRAEVDEKGIYLIETLPEKEGKDTVGYEYVRKGPNPTRFVPPETYVSKVYYDGGEVAYTETLSSYDEATGSWKDAA